MDETSPTPDQRGPTGAENAQLRKPLAQPHEINAGTRSSLPHDRLKNWATWGVVIGTAASLVLTAMTPLEDHQCSLLRPVGN